MNIYLDATPHQVRRHLIGVLRALAKRSGRVFVPGAGSFTLVRALIEAGVSPGRIYASDVSLFSGIIGYYYSGQPLATLPLKLEEPHSVVVTLLTDEAEHAAYLLWLLKLAQLGDPDNPFNELYYRELVQHQQKYRDQLSAALRKNRETFRGVHFELSDIRAMFDRTPAPGDSPPPDTPTRRPTTAPALTAPALGDSVIMGVDWGVGDYYSVQSGDLATGDPAAEPPTY